MEQPTASQVIVTNAAFMLEKELREKIAEIDEYRILCKKLRIELKEALEENAKLKSKLESISKYAEELGEEIFKAEGSC